MSMKPYPKKIGVGDFEFSEHERRHIERVLNHRALSYGPLCQEFEERFAKRHGVKHAIVCNSGTSALHLSLTCLKEVKNWKEDTEVILPALTFVATLNMVLEVRLKPVLVDVDPKTYNMDPKEVAKAINSKTGAILPVHLFGQPCAMDEIMALAQEHNLCVIEDSAETMFAQFEGTFVGGFGDLACFSTYMAHLLVTGVGGFVTTNNDEYAKIIRSLINHGRDPVYLAANTHENNDASKEEVLKGRFRFLRHGFSYRMTELEAAVGLGQLDRIDELMKKRLANADYLNQSLSTFKDQLQLPHTHHKATHSYMMYPILLKDRSLSKWALIEFLEANNIETREMLPLTNQPVYENRWQPEDYPNSNLVNETGFYIGCHPYLTHEELDFIFESFKNFFERKKS